MRLLLLDLLVFTRVRVRVYIWLDAPTYSGCGPVSTSHTYHNMKFIIWFSILFSQIDSTLNLHLLIIIVHLHHHYSISRGIVPFILLFQIDSLVNLISSIIIFFINSDNFPFGLLN